MDPEEISDLAAVSAGLVMEREAAVAVAAASDAHSVQQQQQWWDDQPQIQQQCKQWYQSSPAAWLQDSALTKDVLRLEAIFGAQAMFHPPGGGTISSGTLRSILDTAMEASGSDGNDGSGGGGGGRGSGDGGRHNAGEDDDDDEDDGDDDDDYDGSTASDDEVDDDPPDIQIFVMMPTGSSLVVATNAACCIGDIKDEIKDREGIPRKHQRLVFAGRQTKNGRTVGHYKIRDASTVDLAPVSKDNTMVLVVQTDRHVCTVYCF